MSKVVADADRPYGQRVKITGGMKEFVGQTGTIQTKDGRQYRVKLDTPVEIPGVGKVKDDLWGSNLLKTVGGSRNDSISRLTDGVAEVARRMDALNARADAVFGDADKRDARYSSGEGQKALMAKSMGLPEDTYTKKIDLKKTGDYGADPIGNGKFRMVPSGDIVDYAERMKRLKK